ncbi:MAG: amino acid racemase [Gammaproteobacteria bacterium]
MSNDRRVVGVLGGMGPEATLDLLQRVVRGTPARDDADHIRILVDNNPGVPSRIEYVIHGRGDSPLPTLTAMAKGLVEQGADFLIMPCNTAHLYADEIGAAVNVPLVSMVETALAAVVAMGPEYRRLGLLASTAVVQTHLYETACEQNNIVVVTPDPERQARLMSIIKSVKAASQAETDAKELNEIGASLSKQVDCLLIACTELSAFSQGLELDVPVIDASQCLAEETIKIALGRKPL